jgi:hypothetical protein
MCPIELHAPTNSTQKLKLMGKGGQFTYTPTCPMRLNFRVTLTSSVNQRSTNLTLVFGEILS